MLLVRCGPMSEDLYLKGIFDKKFKQKNNKNKFLVCSQCGSKNIEKITALEPVFVNTTIIYKCQNCSYQGEAKVIKSS